jgi:hypothetical protein
MSSMLLDLGKHCCRSLSSKKKKKKEKKDFVWLDYLKPESKIVVKMKHIP